MFESPPPAVLGQRRASNACPDVDRDQHHTLEVLFGVIKRSSSLEQALCFTNTQNSEQTVATKPFAKLMDLVLKTQLSCDA